jgi:organic radical activating enzyme
VFVRLGGCNLACSFCDTEFESFHEMPLADLLAKVTELAEDLRKLVVITGGEPLRQNIAPLCEALLAKGFMVQIETNGTLYRELPEAVTIICSPKNSGQGYHPVRADLLPRIQAFKFIISSHKVGYQGVAEVGQGATHAPVYVQPMDEYDEEKNRRNQRAALQLASQHGYRLSLQLHKILGIE